MRRLAVGLVIGSLMLGGMALPAEAGIADTRGITTAAMAAGTSPGASWLVRARCWS